MDFNAFINLVISVLGEQRRPNGAQLDCLQHVPDQPLLIVAGPGTGKTTVLVLRALRHVLVDRISPEQILITTFTRKAAREIRTRLIEWGIPIIEHLLAGRAGTLDQEFGNFLRNVDINRFVTGTLDSLCEEAIAADREPDELPPTVIEAFAANQILARRGEIFRESQAVGQPFRDYLGRYTLTGDAPQTVGDMTRVTRTLIDRFIQDDVDLAAYLAAPGPDLVARQAIGRIYQRYREHLHASNQMDFSALERVVLDRIEGPGTPGLMADARAILIDEYQDTNPLQERLYLQLASATNASLTVVGDDDQSLYRFRGATIELFRDFSARSVATLGEPAPRLLYLTENYRSTPNIVQFFNSFVQNDPDFAPARIQPPKPAIQHNMPPNGVPILGMFRPDADVLAADLAAFLHSVFRGGGWPGIQNAPEPIRSAANGGDFGDAVLLASTVNEFTRSFRGQPPRARLPRKLRQQLHLRNVDCFNPRGRALKDIPEVIRLLGLVLECIDPSSAATPQGPLVSAAPITNIARDVFRAWRADAAAFRATNPGAMNGKGLENVIADWQQFAQQGRGRANEWPLLDIFYSLIPWIRGFQDDPECQVYLEAISRSAAEAATFSAYRALVLRDEPHRSRSIQSIIRDILAAVADDLVEVDEDIMPSVPRNRFNMMTIHQAKGLEFPLVIVDVASDFKKNSPAQKFRRFPDDPSSVAIMEDDLAACTPIGALRTQRTAIQRSFEDLIRLYYVAYSRPQSVLMLVGCLPCLRHNTTIPHVATFWRRDGSWPWRLPAAGRQRPSLADALPFIPV